MKKKAYLLIVLYFFYGIGVSFIHPITPEFVNSLALSDFYYGLFFSMMSLGMFAGSWFFGWASKHVKRIYLLCLGIFFYGVGQFLFGFANSIPLLILVWRFFGGFAVAAPWSFFATFANELTTSKNTRDRLILLLAPIEIIGEAIGYKIGGYLYSNTPLSFQHVFIIQVSVLTILSIATFFILRKEEQAKVVENNHVSVEKHAKTPINPLLIGFFFVIMFTTLSTILTTKYTEKYTIELGYTSDDLGTIMMVTALVGVAASLIYSFLAKKIKIKYRIVHTALIAISSIAVLVTYLIPSSRFLVGIYSSYIVFYASKVLVTSTDMRIVIDNSTEENKGLHMGIRQSFIAFGNFAGPLIGGVLYSNNPLLCFYVSSGTFALTLVITLTLIAIEKVKRKQAIIEQ